MGKKERKAKELLEARGLVSKAEQAALDEANGLREEAARLLEDTRRAARENLEWAEQEAKAVLDSAQEDADDIRDAARTARPADERGADPIVVSLIDPDGGDRLRQERDDAQRQAGEQAGRLAEEALALLKSIQELGSLVVGAAQNEADHVRAEAAQLEEELAARRAEIDAEIKAVIKEAAEKIQRLGDEDRR